MSDVVEKIKQKAKSIDQVRTEIIANLPSKISPRFAERYHALQKELKKKEWIKLDVVLKTLSEQQQKFQELADLLKNLKELGEKGSDDIPELIEAFEVFEKKFAELGVDTKKEKPTK